MTDEVESGRTVKFNNIGKFLIKERAGHKGRNLKTKEPIIIPDHSVFCFVASLTYRHRLRALDSKK